MSSSRFSRREAMKVIGATAVTASVSSTVAGRMASAQWMPERKSLPKICLGYSGGEINEQGNRRIKQIGVDYVLMGGPPMPWTEAGIRERMDKLKAGGITLCNMMIGGYPNTIYGKPGRDEEIAKIKESIVAAGKAGLPVVEHNFYAHRAMEGYYETSGRAGVGHTSFDYEKMKGLPPLPEEGAHKLEEMWANISYMLKAVIPVAEKAGVRLALHPNDPPAPISRGSEQIMGTVAGWKRLIETVNSPSNGITFDCGVTKEMGEDPVEVCKYFISRDRVNHMHFRNVRVQKPYEKYDEVSIDEGDVNMFAVMKEAMKAKWSFYIYPEHQRGLDYDREVAKAAGGLRGYPGGGGYAGTVFCVAYTRAMMQAVMASMPA